MFLSNIAPAICFCVLLHIAVTTTAENVLISASVGEGSHYFVGKTVGKYLAKHGHNVTVLLSNAYAHRARNPDDAELNFIIFNHTVPPESVLERHQAYSKVALKPFGLSFMLELVRSQIDGALNDCEDLFTHNPDVMHRLEDGNFSVVVVDQIWMCSLLLGMKLNAPVVISSPVSAVAMISTEIGNPVNLAVTPEVMTRLTNRMSFLERVSNVMTNLINYQFLYYINERFDVIRKRHRIRPEITGSIMDLVAKYPSLYLLNFDFAVEFPATLNPNLIPMGGITARAASPLPKDLDAFVQSSGDEGIIIFSLGTYVHQVDTDFLLPFSKVFGKVRQKVIWQMKGQPPFPLPKNVKTMSWLPQNDLLGHPKTRLFIFQGGNNGFYESVYHGVPMVIIPLMGDAVDQGIRVVHHGLGTVVDKFDVTVETLATAIKTVLYNKNYTKNVKEKSELLRSRPLHPGDRAAFWVDHVIKHGGQHMKSPALELNFVQRNLLDVFAFLIAGTISVLTVIALTVRCLFRCCKRVCFRSKVKHD